MVRIPEGTFRKEPSTRVGGGAVALDKPDTRSLRKLGSEFKGIANKLDEAQSRADSLEKAARIEDMYNNEVESAKENIKIESRNGKMNPSGSLGSSEEPSSITNEFSRVANKFHQKATALLGEDDHVATQMYTKYVFAKMQKDQNNMAALQSKQIYDFHLGTTKKGRNNILEHWKSGKDISELVAKYHDKLELSIPVLGNEGVAEQALALDNLLGLKASEHVALNSPTMWAQNKAVKEAKERIANIPDEGLRIASERKLKGTIAAVEKARFKAKQEGEKDVATYADDPQDLIENRDTILSLLKSNLTEPRGKYETVDDKAESIGVLSGKMLGASIALQDPKDSLKQITETIDREIETYLTTHKDNAQINEVGVENVRDRMTRHAREYVSAYRDKLKTDNGGQYASRDGNYINALLSGNPQQQIMAVNQAKEYYKKTGGASEDFKIMPNEMIDNFVKQYGEIADKDGAEASALINNFSERLGPNGPTVMKELYARDGGKTVPASAALAVRITDKNTQIEIMKDAAQYTDNIESLITAEKIDSADNFRNDILAKVHKDLAGLRLGRGGENVHLYEASKEALVHRAAAILSQNRESSVGDAYDRALSDIQKQLRTASSDRGALMVDKKYLDKFQPHDYELSSMVNDLSKMKYIDKAGVEINWAVLILMSGEDSALTKYSNIAKKAMKLGSAEGNKKFTNEIKSDMRVIVNHGKSNSVSLMIQPTNRDMVPIPMKVPYPVTEEGRVVIKNEDGSVSTERTETIKIGRKFYNVPTIYKGKPVSTDEAKKIIKSNSFVDPDTGRELRAFDDVDTAVESAKQRSATLDREILLGGASSSQVDLIEYTKAKKAALEFSGIQAEIQTDDRIQASAAFARQSPAFKAAIEKGKEFQELKKRDEKTQKERSEKTQKEVEERFDEVQNFWKKRLKDLDKNKR
jgi:hypothetical protein